MMIGSMVNFEALIFFLGHAHSTMCGRFNYVDAVPRSMLPSSISISSTSCLCEDVAWPSFTFMVAASTLSWLMLLPLVLLLLLLQPFSTLWLFVSLPALAFPQLLLFQLGDAQLGIILFLLCFHLLQLYQIQGTPFWRPCLQDSEDGIVGGYKWKLRPLLHCILMCPNVHIMHVGFKLYKTLQTIVHHR